MDIKLALKSPAMVNYVHAVPSAPSPLNRINIDVADITDKEWKAFKDGWMKEQDEHRAKRIADREAAATATSE